MEESGRNSLTASGNDEKFIVGDFLNFSVPINKPFQRFSFRYRLTYIDRYDIVINSGCVDSIINNYFKFSLEESGKIIDMIFIDAQQDGGRKDISKYN